MAEIPMDAPMMLTERSIHVLIHMGWTADDFAAILSGRWPAPLTRE